MLRSIPRFNRRTLLSGLPLAVLRGADITPALIAWRGVRPRLFLNAARVEELRRSIRGPLLPIWQKLSARAEELAAKKPPAYRADKGEQLWQREVGNTIATLSFVYLISGERRYLEAAGKWAAASCGYPTWGVDAKSGESMDYGLVYGHQLLGLAMLYDYGGDGLATDLRRSIRETLIARTTVQHRAYSQIPHAYLQNHTWINSTGMLAAGLALFDEEPATKQWIALARDILGKTMSMLPDDGASQEGVGYWEYGLEYLLKMMHLSRQMLGDDYYGHPWFRQNPQYALHMSLPRATWRQAGSIVDLADCPRYHWYGPDFQLRRLASEYRGGTAQWLAGAIDEAGTAAPSSPWLNLLWFDPGVKAEAPDRLPAAHHFENMGIVSARSDWSGKESLVVFKCGPALGFQASKTHPELVSSGDFGHTHPDANHFVFFAHGEWLIRNLGYIQRQTRYHNTLLVNGLGQYDATTWFDGYAQFQAHRVPKVLRAEFRQEWCWITGDATEAYRPEAGLRRFVRHVLFLKPDVLIVADEVELNVPGKLELLFHTERPCLAQPDGSCTLRGDAAALRAELLTPDVAKLEPGTLPVKARHPESQKDRSSSLLRLTAEAASLQTVIAFSCGPVNVEPARVTLSRDGAWRVFSVANKTYRFDLGRSQ